MTSSAHTASVWGNGNLALVAAKERKLIEGDEECVICRNDDIPATVALQPCRHVVCIACVELMRANNVFKADKGIKCPFCRGYVEAYEALGSANEAIRKVIDTANKAAALSKGARGFENSRSKPQDGTGGGVDRESWVCTSCNKTNVWWRLGCGTVDCQGSDPVRKQKVPVANAAEIEMNLKERYHLKLNKHFSEIGLIFESGKTADDFKVEAIISALRSNYRGADGFLKMISILRDPSVLLECSKDAVGTFTIQDIAVVAGKLRGALTAAPSLASCLSSFRTENRGLDPLGVLIYSALPNARALAAHKTGTYVIQRVVEYATQHEVHDVASAVFPTGAEVLGDGKAVYLMLRLLKELSSKCCGSWVRSHTQRLVDALCSSLIEPSAANQLHICLGNSLSVQVVSGAISLGAPGNSCRELIQIVALKVHSLKKNPLSLIKLLDCAAPGSDGDQQQELRRQEGGDTMVAEVDMEADLMIRDFICMIALQLKGNLLLYLLSSEALDLALVEKLISRLEQEQEHVWINHFATELMNHAEQLVIFPASRKVIVQLLSSNLMEGERVDVLLLQVGERANNVVDELADAVYNARESKRMTERPARFTTSSPWGPDSRFEIISNKMVLKHPSYMATMDNIQTTKETIYQSSSIQQTRPLQSSNGGGHSGGFIMPLPFPVVSPEVHQTSETKGSGREDQENRGDAGESLKALFARAALVRGKKQDELKGHASVATPSISTGAPLLPMPVPENSTQSNIPVEQPPVINVEKSTLNGKATVSSSSFLPPHLAAAMKAAQNRESGKSASGGAPPEAVPTPASTAASVPVPSAPPTAVVPASTAASVPVAFTPMTVVAPASQDTTRESQRSFSAASATSYNTLPGRNHMPLPQQSFMMQQQHQLHMSGAERFVADHNMGLNVQYALPGISGPNMYIGNQAMYSQQYGFPGTYQQNTHWPAASLNQAWRCSSCNYAHVTVYEWGLLSCKYCGAHRLHSG